MTTYPRSAVRRQDFLTPYRGIDKKGQPEWRYTYAWEVRVYACPDDVPNSPIDLIVSEDFDNAIHYAHTAVTCRRDEDSQAISVSETFHVGDLEALRERLATPLTVAARRGLL